MVPFGGGPTDGYGIGQVRLGCLNSGPQGRRVDGRLEPDRDLPTLGRRDVAAGHAERSPKPTESSTTPGVRPSTRKRPSPSVLV